MLPLMFREEPLNWTRMATCAVVGATLAGFMLGGAVAKDGSIFGPTVAAWVQGIGALVGLAVAIYLPWADRQRSNARELAARFGLMSERDHNDMLAVTISFTPDRRNSGLVAEVTLLDPPPLALLLASRGVTQQVNGRYQFSVIARPEPSKRTVRVGLGRVAGEPDDGTQRGAFLITTPDGPEPDSARLRVRIISTADDKVIYQENVAVGGEL